MATVNFMSEETQIPFLTALDRILTADPLPIDLLYRLSDLSDKDFAAFQKKWPEAADERRRVVTQHMVDICEDNFVVDFTPVFVHAFKDANPFVREAALNGVWDATDTTLIAPIIEMMQTDESDGVRAAAAAALAHYVLLAEWGQLPRSSSKPIVQALLTEYEKEETALPVKRAALEALGAAHHPRVEGLISEAYQSSDFDMQLSAVFAMGNSADTRWLGTVLSEMEHPDADMRAEAARAAGFIGGSDVVDALANLIADELEVAMAAVTALGMIGGHRVQEILAGLLDDEEAEALHEAASEALEELALLGGDLSFDWLAYDDEIE